MFKKFLLISALMLPITTSTPALADCPSCDQLKAENVALKAELRALRAATHEYGVSAVLFQSDNVNPNWGGIMCQETDPSMKAYPANLTTEPIKGPYLNAGTKVRVLKTDIWMTNSANSDCLRPVHGAFVEVTSGPSTGARGWVWQGILIAQ